MRRVLFPLILASLVLGLCVYGVSEGSAVAASLQNRRGTNLVNAQRALRFIPRSIKSANRRLRYTIDAKYPQAVGAQRDPRLAKLNRELHSLITKSIGEFRKDFQAPEERMGTGSSYETEYAVSLSTPNLVSLTFYVNTYYEGAAHGNHQSIAFNYDLSAGRTLALANLFKPGTYYLEGISAYAIRELEKKLAGEADREWIQKGAGAVPENYKSWNITKTGLVVTFDPYQVTYYAAGPQEVTIPFSSLKSLIDPTGPLAGMIK